MRQFRKRHAPVFLVVFCLAVILFFSASASGYEDLSRNHWAYEEILFMTQKGVLSGYPDGSFRPEDAVTYGELLKMVLSAAGYGTLEIASSPDHWARRYYDRALHLQWMTKNDFSFSSLGQPIPRMHMALILYGAIKEQGNFDFQNKEQIPMKDITHQTPYAFEIEKTLQAGLLSGYPDGSFHPGQTLTRAEAAVAADGLMKFRQQGQHTEADEKSQAKQDLPPHEESSEQTDWSNCPLSFDEIEELESFYPIKSWVFSDQETYPVRIQKENGVSFLLIGGVTHGLFFLNDGVLTKKQGESQLYLPSENALMVMLQESISDVDFFVIEPQTKEGILILLDNPYQKE